ncbi:hypothetical protein MP213Fo_09100 [Pseudochrobactrum sp. MP213Fo]
MSIAVMSRLFKVQLGTAGRKMLAIRLGDFADDEGRGIWPSVGRLAIETDLSPRQVQRLLADFVTEGLLKIIKEGGGGRGTTTRYDFDMDVVERLIIEQKTNIKGDTMSPLENLRVTSMTVKGDIHDSLGCHHVTQTVIEPLDKPSIEREVRESNFEKDQVDEHSTDDPSKFERRVKKIAHDTQWHNWAKSPTEWAVKQFAKLTDAERAEAEQKAMAYARHCGKQVVPLSIYFRDRKWADLPVTVLQALEADEARSSGVRKAAAPYGKMWGAGRMAELVAGAKPLTRPSKFIESMILQGGDVGARYKRDWLMKAGFPKVVEMHEAAKSRRGYIVDERYLAVCDHMEQVRVGGDLWAQWRDLHEKNGWLWFDECDVPEWVWFPAGGAELLNDFKEMLSEVVK